MNNKELIILVPQKQSLSDIMKRTLVLLQDNSNCVIIEKSEDIIDLHNKIVLFFVELNKSGINLELQKMLEYISDFDEEIMR